MMTVHEVSKLTGVSIRTLHYYDKIGLLSPSKITQAGYRLYDDAALERLQQILLFKELEFPLKEIRQILDSPDFDKKKALETQIELLTLKKEHLEHLILFARRIKRLGANTMDFTAFDTSKLEEYTAQAKAQWGTTVAYKEFEEKSKGRSKKEEEKMAQEMMQIFKEFGAMKEQSPADEAVQKQVKKLQDYISTNFYQCTKEILASLGKMYNGSGEFTENIDKAGGEGCAAFTAEAIAVYCKGK